MRTSSDPEGQRPGGRPPDAGAVPMAGLVALVTGGGGGIGAAICGRLAAAGGDVVVADIDPAVAAAVASRIRATGGAASPMRLDVTSEASWRDAVGTLDEDRGRLDILVNNAGVISRRSIAATDVRSWSRVIEVNLMGPVLGMKTCADIIARGGGGSMINIGSTAGVQAHYDVSYGASKWGLRGASKVAALEFADRNIRVNCVHPGLTLTDMAATATSRHADSTRDITPLGHLVEPADVAELVAFLAAPGSRSVTGGDFVVDGGYTVGGAAWHRRAAMAREEPRP